MRVSYAVVWWVGNGPRKTGRLELLSDGFRLEPLSGSAGPVRGIAYESLTGIRVTRDKEHPGGRRTLVVERRSGPPITITSAARPSLMRGMFERLAARQFATANEAVALACKRESAERTAAAGDEVPPSFAFAAQDSAARSR